MAFNWDKGNLAHIAEHGVTQTEAEAVVNNNPLDLEIQMVDGEERTLLIGSTRTGRVLMIVTTWRADELRVVTAYPASPGFRQLYLREKGSSNVRRRNDKDS